MPAKKPATKKKTTTRKLGWIAFLKKYHKDHPNLTYSEAMSKASAPYHKQK